MKVVFVRPVIQKRDIELIQKLSETGIDVHIVTNKIISTDMIPSYISLINSKSSIRVLYKIVRVLKSMEFDLIVGFFSSYMFPYAVFLGKCLRKPVVYHVTQHPRAVKDLKLLSCREILTIIKTPSFLRDVLFSMYPLTWLTTYASRSTWIKKIIVPSYRQMSELKSLGVPKEKIALIPSGINTEIFEPRKIGDFSQENLFGTDQVKIIGYYGSSSTLRGADTMITSFSLLSSRFPDARLLMLITDEENHKHSIALRKLIEKHKFEDKALLFYGYRDYDDILRFLKTVDIVALPFKFSSAVAEIPLTVLEAMFMNRIIVTTTVNAASELINSYIAGLIVPPGKPVQFANALIKALTMDNPRNDNIRDNLKLTFGLERNASKVTNTLLEVVNRA